MKNQKIRELENLEDFNRVYQVFSGAPYYEKYTDEEIKEIYDEYKEKGKIYGAFDKENECIGIVAVERGVKKDHPVSFNNGDDEVMYLAEVAVLDKYRKAGVGSQLMLYAVMESKLLGYKKMYMRTIGGGKSMSYNIANKIGFKQIPNVCQNVEKEKVDGNVTALPSIFLELDLNSLNRESIGQVIKNPSLDSKEREI